MIRWRVQRLTQAHRFENFDCGEPTLNSWLATQALRAQRSDTGRTYVWVPPDSLRVDAYCTLAPTEVRRTELTSSVSGGFSVVPGYVLARLALDQRLRGRGLGAELLVNAITKIVAASDMAAGRIIVVDAIGEDAASFYRRHGFQAIKNNPRRLVLKMTSARAAVEKA